MNGLSMASLAISGVLVFAMQGCDQTKRPDISQGNSERSSEFVNFVKKELVFVEGGTFLMGDYGVKYGQERLPYDRDSDSKPVHEIELSSFSMSKFKVTNAQYRSYLTLNGLTLRGDGSGNTKKWDEINSADDTPAHVDWYEAEKYCAWLGSVSGLPFKLPTEAQWEYAARSRGQFLMVATDDGTYKAEPSSKRTALYDPKGLNISTEGDRIAFSTAKGWKLRSSAPLPVGMFPPNPLGLYSMTDNGFEWVNDWYDPDYYSQSPPKDPGGPKRPVYKNSAGYYMKVMRGQDYANPYWGGGVNVHRTPKDPYGRYSADGALQLVDKTMRCVVNNSELVAL